MNDSKDTATTQQTSKVSLPDIRPGDTVRVYQKIQEGEKERLQAFEGLVIARKHGKGPTATITVRKFSFGIGIERIFPLHSPTIKKIEILKRSKVRRAKLYYVRKQTGKKIRKRKLLELPATGIAEKAAVEETAEEKAESEKPAETQEEQGGDQDKQTEGT